ncbi:hypothetical protein MRB53_039491 [Persea americana]|nr:hypothetical protein MRB53_039491 [Persea americana]
MDVDNAQNPLAVASEEQALVTPTTTLPTGDAVNGQQLLTPHHQQNRSLQPKHNLLHSLLNQNRKVDVPQPIETSPQPEAEPTINQITEPQPSHAESGQNLLNGMQSSTEPPTSTMSSVDAPASIKTETTAPSLVRPRDEDMDDEPAAKRSKVDEIQANDESQIEPTLATVAPTDAEGDVSMADVSITEAAPAVQGESKYYTNAMTPLQKAYLLEKTKNTKKTKHATYFLTPVDHVKLGIPTYPDIVKNPMDLSTLENKLKTDQYATPQAYADDFDLIVTNSRLFNGATHEAAIPRPQPRREARVSQPPPISSPAPAAASPSASNAPTFALQADGTPQIRRDSTIKRPHRTIKPPQSRELSYAKPKRKEHQLELKFCEHVLDVMRGPAYNHVNHVFLTPVDPVALNIPHYRQIVKKPMDMSTMAQKLKSGQYGTAKEFKADFDLMIENCMIFNPVGNPVRDLGVEMKNGFESLWKDKEKWERANKKSSERASSEEESEEESEEDEDEDDPAASARETIAALTKQLADLQKTVAAASWSGGTKKKSKDGKKSKKNSLSAPIKQKSGSKSKAPKKVKALSYDDKQEISNAVTRMNEQQVSKLTQIIIDNCEKYRNMGDEMELEIDDLPNDIQAMLLKYVRSLFGNPNRGARVASPDDLAAEDDDDFAPPARDRPAGAGKRKKHKPMGKKEQQDSIAELKSRLAAFDDPSGADAGSALQYGQPADDTSGDEESEESEEE